MLKRSLLVEGSCSRSAFISALPGTTGRLLSLQAAAGSTFYLLLYTFTPLRCLCSNDICTIHGKFGSHLLLDIKETNYRTTLQAACPWSHSQYMPPSYITLKAGRISRKSWRASCYAAQQTRFYQCQGSKMGHFALLEAKGELLSLSLTALDKNTSLVGISSPYITRGYALSLRICHVSLFAKLNCFLTNKTPRIWELWEKKNKQKKHYLRDSTKYLKVMWYCTETGQNQIQICVLYTLELLCQIDNLENLTVICSSGKGGGGNSPPCGAFGVGDRKRKD